MGVIAEEINRTAVKPNRMAASHAQNPGNEKNSRNSGSNKGST